MNRLAKSRLTRIGFIAAILTITVAGFAGADGWQRGEGADHGRWQYEETDGRKLAGTLMQPNWQWLDGNGDGRYECYAFDQNGWMFAHTITPDGYQVNPDGAWIVDDVVQVKQLAASADQVPQEKQIRIRANGNELVFELNDSQAAREFYRQLPLSVAVQNFGGIEKIFYLPEKLNTRDTPAANPRVGTLAYYAPWGNIAIFYGNTGASSGLYELGRVISGSEYIGTMSDTIEIEVVE